MAISKPLVIVLLGPTASGKTDLGIELAEELQIDIHNIDSRQAYKGMDIGTAKPNLLQQTRVTHHLIDIQEPDKPMTLQEFKKLADQKLEKALIKKGIALLVGGSGLYLKAITKGYEPPKVSPQNHLRNQFNQLGQNLSHELLRLSDPIAGNRIAARDKSRTHRALEVFYATGKSITSQQISKPPAWNILELGLDPEDLQERIVQRTIEIYKNGLLDETEQLRKKFGENLPLLQTIGYREALDTIQGKFSLEKAIATTTYRTQKFAKRQRTWFQRQHQAHWLKNQELKRESMSLIKARLG